MSLTILIIKADQTEKTIERNDLPNFRELQRYIDGHVIKIRHFDTIVLDNDIKPCVAFCDENGLPRQSAQNLKATKLSFDAAVRNNSLVPNHGVDYLVGDVAICYGDKRLVNKLRKRW